MVEVCRSSAAARRPALPRGKQLLLHPQALRKTCRRYSGQIFRLMRRCSLAIFRPDISINEKVQFGRFRVTEPAKLGKLFGYIQQCRGALI
jgi:hypothetical protein